MKRILILLLLSGCCSEDNRHDCTQDQLADIDSVGKSNFVSEQNGVKLYSVTPCWGCRTVYFTTPCGDVNWTTEEGTLKTPNTVSHQTMGAGCK